MSGPPEPCSRGPVNLGPGRSTNITVKLSARSYTIFCGIHPSLMHTSFRAT